MKVIFVLLLAALTGCANGDGAGDVRSGDADQRPVFYGGVSGSAVGR